jgi:hypothetical protein
MPGSQPTPSDRGRYTPAVSAFLRCRSPRRLHTPEPRPPRHHSPDLLGLLYPSSGARICQGCPMVAGVPDHAVRFPTCEVCRWPAIGLGPVHAWH